ncbi:hypothetical protein A7981_06285 [Methylovorus sp. MM2]|uniref:tetratricopeptide repeat protein n=1 Tax=Methylovorus sp. MM2 TaxID=1848038 RepID=UPI0007E13F94|nr:tetratricopeptide repeat protein [Methylovorus sp. MM2]OAM53031.1 hypothetical protein A7981_06285 [Methylovorus sp. MM2]
MSLRYIALATLFTVSTYAHADLAGDIAACNQAINQGDADKAMSLSEKILKQNKSNRDGLICKGRAYSLMNQVPESLASLEKAKEVSQTPIDQMVALVLIGNVKKNAQQYVEAIESYEQGLTLARAENNKRFERINLNLIGETLVDSGQLTSGLESYLAGSKLAANDNERGDNYARIADTYSRLGKHELAIEFQVKAMLMQAHAGDTSDYANAMLELGRIYTAANDYPNAEKYIQKVIKLSKEQGGAYWEARSYYYLALAKIANKQTADVQPLLADAQKICDQIGAKELNDQVSKVIDQLAVD